MEVEQGTKYKGTGVLTWFERMLKKPFANRLAKKSKRAMMRAMRNMGTEKEETIDMAKSFFRLLESKLNLNERKTPPTKEELKVAIDQLLDLGRFSFFAGISILPGGAFGLLALEILARKFGLKNFTLLPSSFREKRLKRRRRLKKMLSRPSDFSSTTPPIQTLYEP